MRVATLNYTVLFLMTSILAACGGGGSGGSSSSPAATGGGAGNNSTTSPSLTGLVCSSSTSSPYVGCFVSNSCESVTGSTYHANYILQFRNDGSLYQTETMYTTQDCTGKIEYRFNLPLIQSYSVGQNMTASNGSQAVTGQIIQLDNTTAGATPVTRYTLSYLNNNQLCFSQGDYTWSSGGEFSPVASSPGTVDTTLNLTDCLSRL